MQALSGSGMSCMSDSWIAFQPAIEEPSNMIPSLKVSSSTVEMSTVTCCHLPRGSVKRKSTYFTSLSLIIFKASLAVVIERIPLSCGREIIEAGLIDGIIVPNATGLPARTVRLKLSWAGHEFLDAARNDTIWHKAGERIKKSGVNVTFTLLSELLAGGTVGVSC